MSFSDSTASCPAASRTTVESTAPSSSTAAATRTRPTQRARVTMFFDGTLNNRANTSARLLGAIPAGAHVAGEEDSYTNDLSNVARLEPKLNPCGAPYDQHFKFYIEGIGTTDGQSDSTAGAATGMFGTGIPAKVRRGLSRAVRALRTMPVSKDFEYIHTDAFGFSRGAAAARHYIHKALHAAPTGGGEDAPPIESRIDRQLEEAGYVVNALEARFGGLFDTVASYGVAHFNDTWELSLGAVSSCRQVFQIAAGDEHRDNFRLTNINSVAGRDSFELFLPGVHSDIGGGYRAGATENLVLWEDSASNAALWYDGNERRNTERNWMIAKGWFTAAQMRDETVEIPGGPLAPGTTIYRLHGTRTVASNLYALIPLKMMADFAREQELVFTGLDSFSGDGFLSGVYGELSRYAAEKRSLRRSGTSHPSSPSHWIHRATPMLQQLRRGYFHMSSSYNAVAGGLIHPNAPNFDGETRHRVIQNG